MTGVVPAVQEVQQPSRRKHPVLMTAAIALCALVAGAAAAVVIYTLVDDDAAITPQPSTVVVPVNPAAAEAMDRYKDEAKTAVAISPEQQVLSPAAGGKDEADTAAAIGNGRADTDPPTSRPSGVPTVAPHE